MNKSDYTQLLHDNVLLVKFTKKDGTLREMKCTLKTDTVESLGLKPKGLRVVPDHQVCCVDVEINEFRSFTIDSVLSYEII
jgi:hypothetical protein